MKTRKTSWDRFHSGYLHSAKDKEVSSNKSGPEMGREPTQQGRLKQINDKKQGKRSRRDAVDRADRGDDRLQRGAGEGRRDAGGRRAAPELARCPQCNGKNVSWDSWAATGYRDVHGIDIDEYALGYQLRCKDCEACPSENPQRERRKHCWVTTSADFWTSHRLWDIPGMLSLHEAPFE